VSLKWVFSAVAALSLAAGTAFWLGNRAANPPGASAQITPAALLAASFADTAGRPQTLGRFQGKILVVNFWATWCAPCREEMPAFKRLQDQWAGRGVQFVGLADDEPQRVERFGRDLGINYPLWVGGDEVGDLAQRLGNRRGVLPYTVVIGPAGDILERRVGAYSESELDSRLQQLVPKSG
jgi:thiol-disulfide isomerase/thioredoxin